MPETTSPLRLQEHQLAEACQVLARAFFDDPMTVFAIPDDARRAAALPAFFGVGVGLGLRFGEVYTSPETIDGVAVWLPPDVPEFTRRDLVAVGARESEAAMGIEGVRRFDVVLATWGPLHARVVPGPHWYLMLLGVDPPRQGQGVGGALIAPVLARADAAGLPCYLETAKARNVPFYKRHGFEVIVEDTMPEGGFRFWTMRRGAP